MKRKQYSIKIKISYTNTRHLTTQAETAEYLGIKNSSKKALEARCRVLGYEIEFDND
jgi:hypothetical protein